MADPDVSAVVAVEKKDENSVKKIEVEVAYALPHEQVILTSVISEGGTVEEAIKHSGILVCYPEIDMAVNKLGVFGKMAKMATVLRVGDRVEIYRPLIADPKVVRRQRAAEGKRMKKGGGDLKEGEGKTAKAAVADTLQAAKAVKSEVVAPARAALAKDDSAVPPDQAKK